MKAFEYCKHHVAWSSMRNIKKSHKIYHNKNDIKKALKKREGIERMLKIVILGLMNRNKIYYVSKLALISCWRLEKQRYII